MYHRYVRARVTIIRRAYIRVVWAYFSIRPMNEFKRLSHIDVIPHRQEERRIKCYEIFTQNKVVLGYNI